MAIIESIKNYITETRHELKRVVWPSRMQTVRFTLAVIGISVVVAIYLGALDFLFTFLLEKFIFS